MGHRRDSSSSNSSNNSQTMHHQAIDYSQSQNQSNDLHYVVDDRSAVPVQYMVNDQYVVSDPYALNDPSGVPLQYVVNDPSNAQYVNDPSNVQYVNDPSAVAYTMADHNAMGTPPTGVVYNNTPQPVMMADEAPPLAPPPYSKREVIIAIVALVFIIAGAVMIGVANPTYSSCISDCYYSTSTTTRYSTCFKRCINTYKALKNAGIAVLIIGILGFVGDGAYTFMFLPQQHMQHRQQQQQQQQQQFAAVNQPMQMNPQFQSGQPMQTDQQYQMGLTEQQIRLKQQQEMQMRGT
jgi:flagellar basal body-associated protein FliL